MIYALVGNMYDSRGIFVSFVETKTYKSDNKSCSTLLEEETETYSPFQVEVILNQYKDKEEVQNYLNYKGE